MGTAESKDWVQIVKENNTRKVGQYLESMGIKKGQPFVPPPLVAEEKEGANAVHFAAHYGHVDLIDLGLGVLWPWGLELRNSHGRTPLLCAAQSGRIPVLERLIFHYRANVHELDFGGNSALLLAAEAGQNATISFLVHLPQPHCLDVFACNARGVNALMIAAARGQLETVRFLIDSYGLDVNAQSASGKTPLAYAVESNRQKVVDLLVVNYGAPVSPQVWLFAQRHPALESHLRSLVSCLPQLKPSSSTLQPSVTITQPSTSTSQQPSLSQQSSLSQQPPSISTTSPAQQPISQPPSTQPTEPPATALSSSSSSSSSLKPSKTSSKSGKGAGKASKTLKAKGSKGSKTGKGKKSPRSSFKTPSISIAETSTSEPPAKGPSDALASSSVSPRSPRSPRHPAFSATPSSPTVTTSSPNLGSGLGSSLGLGASSGSDAGAGKSGSAISPRKAQLLNLPKDSGSLRQPSPSELLADRSLLALAPCYCGLHHICINPHGCRCPRAAQMCSPDHSRFRRGFCNTSYCSDPDQCSFCRVHFPPHTRPVRSGAPAATLPNLFPSPADHPFPVLKTISSPPGELRSPPHPLSSLSSDSFSSSSSSFSSSSSSFTSSSFTSASTSSSTTVSIKPTAATFDPLSAIPRIPRDQIRDIQQITEVSGQFGIPSIALYNQTPVFLKKIRRNPDQFHHEAFLLLKCQHPNIIHFYGFLAPEEPPFWTLIFEQASLDLHQLRTDLQLQLAPFERLGLALDLLAGAAHLHSLNCSHNDLKPQNLVVFFAPSHSARDWKLKICDLGSASDNSYASDETAMRCRNKAYIAPECLLHTLSQPSCNQDMFSVGLLLLWLFTRDFTPRLPRREACHGYIYPADHRIYDLIDIFDAEGRNCREPLKKAILSCLHPDPAARATAGEVFQQLDSILQEVPPPPNRTGQQQQQQQQQQQHHQQPQQLVEVNAANSILYRNTNLTVRGPLAAEQRQICPPLPTMFSSATVDVTLFGPPTSSTPWLHEVVFTPPDLSSPPVVCTLSSDQVAERGVEGMARKNFSINIPLTKNEYRLEIRDTTPSGSPAIITITQLSTQQCLLRPDLPQPAPDRPVPCSYSFHFEHSSDLSDNSSDSQQTGTSSPPPSLITAIPTLITTKQTPSSSSSSTLSSSSSSSSSSSTSQSPTSFSSTLSVQSSRKTIQREISKRLSRIVPLRLTGPHSPLVLSPGASPLLSTPPVSPQVEPGTSTHDLESSIILEESFEGATLSEESFASSFSCSRPSSWRVSSTAPPELMGDDPYGTGVHLQAAPVQDTQAALFERLAHVQVPTIRLGEIQVGLPIGKGQFGAVYRGHWRRSEVAIKILMVRGGVTDEEREKFVRECKLLALVSNHPHVVRFFGAGFEDRLFLVMGLCSQGSLADLYNRRPANVLTDRQRVQLAADVAAGVLHLHTEGVVHRDIAARNVLLDDSFRGYVNDFGLARLKQMLNREESNTVDVVTALAWTAPESFLRPGTYSYATDVWAYGVFLYELLAWQVPFPTTTLRDLRAGILSGALTLNPPPTADPILVRLMRRCTQFEAHHRPSMDDIAGELQIHLLEFSFL